MNKKYLLLIIASITLFVSVSFWFLNKNKELVVAFSELKMQEGIIKSIDDEKIVINNEKYVMNPESQEESKVDELISFSLSDNISFMGEVEGIKSEDVYRKQENDFQEWVKKAESEKNSFNFQFSPSWRETAEIKKSSLGEGDVVDIIYYLKGNKMIALKIYKKYKNEKSEGDIQEMINFKFNVAAEILKTEGQKMSVKLLTDISEKYLMNSVLDLFVDNETIMQRLKKKSEQEFATEQKKFDVERTKIMNEGGDVLRLQAPTWFAEEKISVSDLKIGDNVSLEIIIDGDNFLVKKVQQIIK